MASLWKQIGRTAKKAGRAVTHPGKSARDISRAIQHPGRTLRDASKVFKVMAPVFDVASSGVAVIPGIGSGLGSGLATLGAVARGDSAEQIALSAAMGALPGGALVKMAAGGAVGTAKGVIRGKSLGASLMAGGRGAISQAPGGKLVRAAGRAAFNAGGDIVQGTKVSKALLRAGKSAAPAVAGAALGKASEHLGAGRFLRSIRSPDPLRNLSKQAAPALRLAKISTVLADGVLSKRPSLALLPPSAAAAATGLSARSIVAATKAPKGLKWRALSRKAAKLIERYSSIPLAHLSRDTAGLAPDGQTYTVESGDYGVKIAQKLVGDGNRWRELKLANPTIAKRPDPKNYGFVIYPGDVLQLPASWIKSAPKPREPDPIVIIPDPIIVRPPTPKPPVPAPDPVLPMPDVAAAVVLKSKAILAVWSKTDGLKKAGVSDYGARAEDVTPLWTSRDRLQLASFESWRGLSDRSGALTQTAADALHAWAESKANVVKPDPIIVKPPAPKPPAPKPKKPAKPAKPSKPAKPTDIIVKPTTPELPPILPDLDPTQPGPTDPTVPPPEPAKPSGGTGTFVALGVAALSGLAMML